MPSFPSFRLVTLFACLTLAVPSLAQEVVGTPASAAAKADVRLTVVQVKATGTLASGQAPAIDPALAKLPLAASKLTFANYVHEATTAREVMWEETLSAPLGDGGSYVLSARESDQPNRLILSVRETAPASKEPCLALEIDVERGRTNLWFCNQTIGGATYLFFVSAEPLSVQ